MANSGLAESVNSLCWKYPDCRTKGKQQWQEVKMPHNLLC